MAKVARKDNDMTNLEFARNLRAFHHKALWEEEKHFTWWVLVLLSAIVLFSTSANVDPKAKLAFILVGCLVGVVLCCIGFRVFRVEGGYFHKALSMFVVEYNKIYRPPLDKVPDKANKGIGKLIGSCCTCKAGIRDYFQLLFLFLILVFLAIAVISILTLKVKESGSVNDMDFSFFEGL
jgi:hypothetical protein